MATKGWALVVMFICTLFTAVGQLFNKIGIMLLPVLFTNWQLLVGFTCYGVGLILFILAMRGGEVSVLYPIISMSYIWTNILATVFLHEQVSLLQWIGSAGVVVGISLIGFGSRDKSRSRPTLVQRTDFSLPSQVQGREKSPRHGRGSAASITGGKHGN